MRTALIFLILLVMAPAGRAAEDPGDLPEVPERNVSADKIRLPLEAFSFEWAAPPDIPGPDPEVMDLLSPASHQKLILEAGRFKPPAPYPVQPWKPGRAKEFDPDFLIDDIGDPFFREWASPEKLEKATDPGMKRYAIKDRPENLQERPGDHIAGHETALAPSTAE